jgi:hypothetical protein
MKAFLAIVGGFVMAFGMFAGGMLLATTVLTAEPARLLGPSVDVADVWSDEPRQVDASAQEFERLPDALPEDTVAAVQTGEEPAEVQVAALQGELPTTNAPVDPSHTAVVPPREEEPEQVDAQLAIAHLDWCHDRYRSYRASDNTYQPYSGGRRACVSPYFEDMAGFSNTASSDEGQGEARGDYVEYEVYDEYDAYAGYDEGYVDERGGEWLSYADDGYGGGQVTSAEHVAYCFSRYRSYRPSDNSYQPYGGGPRRQCM